MNYKLSLYVFLVSSTMAVCFTGLMYPPDSYAQEKELIKKGRHIFFNETFDGNGRTCGTCHPAENNFTIDPAFIARLPDNDPLFVAEFIPALMENFENPTLMREFGLILENLDGFHDLENKFTMRGVPHILDMSTSIESIDGPRTGWSGDGAPGDGSLRAFAKGAVRQHFPLTTDRVEGIDFRLPTEYELDALEAFQLSLGRQTELELPLSLISEFVMSGQEVFMGKGKCNGCHNNAGANAKFGFFEPGNINVDTGTEFFTANTRSLSLQLIPLDDGSGTPGNGTFNIPSLVTKVSEFILRSNKAI